MKSIKKFNNKQKDLKQSDDIVYIFVSFDRKESIWKNFLEKNSFTAKNVVHLFNGSDMNSDYGKYYNISELPFYMVVGKDGKVKDVDPKEPMDDEYELYIQQLIK
jgi:peroxiredoxin